MFFIGSMHTYDKCILVYCMCGICCAVCIFMCVQICSMYVGSVGVHMFGVCLHESIMCCIFTSGMCVVHMWWVHTSEVVCTCNHKKKVMGTTHTLGLKGWSNPLRSIFTKS